MRASTHRVFQVLLLLALAVSPALAQGSGLISGRVTDERGISIEGVMVSLSGEGILGTRTTQTNEDGWYSFPGISGIEPVTVRAAVPGRTPVAYFGHTVKRDGVVGIDFTLRPVGQQAVLVLMDEGNPWLESALAGATPYLPETTAIVRVNGHGPVQARELRAKMQPRPSAVLALGESAARLARRHIREVPVVHAMVPAPMEADLSTRNLCGVPLLGGFVAQLEHIRHVLPSARTIGTLYNPSRLGSIAAQLREAAEASGFTLVEAHAHAVDGTGITAVASALSQLDGEPFDAFVLLLDPSLIDDDGLALIARSMEQRHILLAVPDPSLVLTEGTFAFGPGFQEMGALAGQLVQRVARGQSQPWQIGTVFPERNEKTVLSQAATAEAISTD